MDCSANNKYVFKKTNFIAFFNFNFLIKYISDDNYQPGCGCVDMDNNE